MNANDRRAPPAPGAPTPPCSQCLHPTVPVPNRENAYRCETPGCPSEGNYFVPVPALPPEIVTALDEYGLAVAQATLAMREPAGQIERAKLLAAITRALSDATEQNNRLALENVTLAAKLRMARTATAGAARDAERWQYLAARRSEVHDRPYTLIMHVNSFVSLAEHVDANMLAARTPTPDSP